MILRPQFANIRVVLVEPSLPENIGSTARAMKTMGLSSLYLVNPKLFPDSRADALAAGATDVLASAIVVDSLPEALNGCVFAAGCSARARDIALPILDPPTVAQKLLHQASRPVALVFGAERTGLSNEDLSRCHVAVYIPTEPDYGSLNLSQAVQVLAYALRMAALHAHQHVGEHQPERESLATVDQLERMFEHFEVALGDIDFLKGRPSSQLMQRIRRMLHRAELDEREVFILRGILAEAQRMAKLAGVAR
jgi:tRNA (cytidine32/uridine32-2'-O)-methyltransferase